MKRLFHSNWSIIIISYTPVPKLEFIQSVQGALYYKIDYYFDMHIFYLKIALLDVNHNEMHLTKGVSHIHNRGLMTHIMIKAVIRFLSCRNEPDHNKTCFRAYASSDGSTQPVQSHQTLRYRYATSMDPRPRRGKGARALR